MTAVGTTTAAIASLADLLEQLGGISPKRVRFRPAPGTATEKDVLAIHDHEDRLYELVHGVLVEKAIGFRESLLAGMLIEILGGFVRARNLGLVTAPDSTMRLAPGLVRIPDVAFISWDRFPNRRVPTTVSLVQVRRCCDRAHDPLHWPLCPHGHFVASNRGPPSTQRLPWPWSCGTHTCTWPWQLPLWLSVAVKRSV